MHLQLSQLSGARSLRFCIFTPSECSGVAEIVPLFHFVSIIWREPYGRTGAALVVWLSPKAEISLCCYVRWWMTGISCCLWSSEGPPKLHSQRHLRVRSLLPLIVDQSGRLWSMSVLAWISPFILLFMCLQNSSSPPLTSSLMFAVFPLSLLASLLLSSLSFCPPAQLLWVTGSGRASFFWNPAIGCDAKGQENESIVGTSIEYLHPFINQVWQGIHIRSHRGVVCWIWQRVCHSDETAGSRR